NNTGSGTVSFDVYSESDDSDFFTVDTSGAQKIAAGESGSVTVKAVSGKSAGTYSGSFYLRYSPDGTNNLDLGPITVTMTVAASGDSTVEDVRSPEGEYTPYEEHIDGMPNTVRTMINGNVAYCVNYYYVLWLSDDDFNMQTWYGNQYGIIPNVTAKELDSYTGLNPNVSPVIYPPNNKGYTPVKVGSASSTVKDNVAKVLYNGYPNDAAGIMDNYDFSLLMSNRMEYAFEIATQMAIWHYTDTDTDGTDLTYEEMKDHVRNVYSSGTPAWGWNDVEEIYNILIGATTYDGITLQDVPDTYETDLYVVDNPISYNNVNYWTQNLISGRQRVEELSITKVWNDDSDADGVRPSASEYTSWLKLYHGTEDVTSQYSSSTYLSVYDNGNNTYTVTWDNLPYDGTAYTITEEIPSDYTSVYVRSDSSGAVSDGGMIVNMLRRLANIDVTFTKKWTDSSNEQSTRPSADDFAGWLTLLADGTAVTDAEPVISATGDVWTVTYSGLERFNDDGDAITYTIQESIPEDYPYTASSSTVSSGGILTNTLTDTTSFSVTKAWVESDGTTTADAPSGATVVLQLVADGSLVSGSTITLDGTTDSNGETAAWTATWTGLDKYDSSGSEITYKAYEVSGPDGYVSDSTTLSTAVEDTVTNTEIGTTTVTLTAGKALVGGTLAADEFSFGVFDSDGNQLYVQSDGSVSTTNSDTPLTATNTAAGIVTFPTITYTYADAGNTYTYYIKETSSDTSTGITYDTAVYKADVTVSRTDAALSTSVLYTKYSDGDTTGTGTSASEIIFTNTQTSESTITGTFQLEATKTTSDYSSFDAGEFTFTMCDENGNALYYHSTGNTIDTDSTDGIPLTATNDADGNIVFPEITLTFDEYTAPITNTYYIKEVVDSSDTKWEAITAGPIKVEVTFTQDSETSNVLTASYDYYPDDDDADSAAFVNERKDVSITVTKVFADGASLADGESITIDIMRTDGTSTLVYTTVTLTGDSLTATVDDLPAVADDGTEYTYYVEEVGSNYTSTVTENSDGSYTVTNSPSTVTTNLSFNKVWNDGASADYIDAILLRDGVRIDTARLDGVSGWSVTFSDLPVYASDGHEYEYTFEESSEGVYVQSGEWSTDGKTYTLTNSPNTETFDMPVTKAWADGATGEAHIILRQDGVQYGDEVVLTSTTGWTYTFENLRKYADDGHEYTYTVEETNSRGYSVEITQNGDHDITAGYTITNSPNEEKIDIDIIKLWADGVSGEEITVVLKQDNVQYGNAITLTSDDNWRTTIEDLPKYSTDGHEYSYTVEETNTNYTPVYIHDAGSTTWVITNYQNETTISIPVEKIWVGRQGEYADIKLLANDEEVGSVRLNESNHWKHTFVNLPKYTADGTELVYTVTEDTMEGYDITITGDEDSGFVITNTDQAKTSVSVEKSWSEGKEGEYADIKLLADGEEVDSIRLDESNNWKYTFEDLQKYNSDGSEIVYTVSEVEIDGYISSITGDAENGFLVTNTYAKISIPVEKVWASGKKGEYADIKLLANGEEVDSVRLDESNNWKYTFEDLDKYDSDGNEIVYTVSEVKIDGFTVTITGDAESGFVVTNSSEIVQTGDTANSIAWAAAAAASAAAGAVLILKKKKSKS
ncbi:MAG: Cna B-type domain-containing protein, partial [Oscillospiraceae bacterium]